MSAIDPATKAHWRRVYDDCHAELWDGAQLEAPLEDHATPAGPVNGSAVRKYCPAIAFRHTMEAVADAYGLDYARAAAFLTGLCDLKDPRP